jgi:pimeloyl-ACP methyl ester carboxylesterase
MALHHHPTAAHETTMLLKPTTTESATDEDQPHQRTAQHPEIDEERGAQSSQHGSTQASPISDDDEEEEDSPLASFPDDDNDENGNGNGGYSPRSNKHHPRLTCWFRSSRQRGMCCCLLLLGAIAAVTGYWYLGLSTSDNKQKSSTAMIIPVEQAVETRLNVTDAESGRVYQLWFRTWGRSLDDDDDTPAIPIVFFHGGPGNAIADYFGNSNQRFFQNQNHNFFVVEVDQRGTGQSQPSVRDDMDNMRYYADISIDKMCADFEAIRKHLKISKWLVWGGSFGSTLAINYGQRYPDSCLALIVRGIYLDTVDEVYAIYARKSYLNNTKRLREFDILYSYAADYYAKQHQQQSQQQTKDQDNSNNSVTSSSPPGLDPSNAEQLLRIYAEMISENHDRHAVWHWFVFENNLMETDPANILNPYEINDEFYAESQSVAFFETRLWLHGSFEAPISNLMDKDKIHQLNMPIWICQGQFDEVCPPRYAQMFVNAVTGAGGQSPWIVSRFLNGSHEDTDPAIAFCLKQSLREFVDYSQGQDGGSGGTSSYNLAW